MESRYIAGVNEVMDFRITPDEQTLVIYHKKQAYEEGNLQIHSLRDNSIVVIPRHPDVWKSHVITPLFDISPNGRFIVVTYDVPRPDGHDGMTFYIWDNHNQTYLPPFASDEVEHKSFAAGGVDGQQGYDLIAVRFLPDNDRLLTVTASGEVFVWSITQNKLLWFVSAAAHLAESVAFSNKLGLFAIFERTTDVRVGKIGQYFTSGDKILYRNFGHDEHGAVMTSETLNIETYFRLWNVYSGTFIRDFEYRNQVNQLVFSPDDTLIAGVADGLTCVWNVETGHLTQILAEHTQPIGFIHNDNHIVLQVRQQRIGVWNFDFQDWYDVHEFDGMIVSAQITADNKLYVLCRTLDAWIFHQITLETYD